MATYYDTWVNTFFLADVGQFLVEHGFRNILASTILSYELNDIMIIAANYMEPYIAVRDRMMHMDERKIPFDMIRKILQSTKEYNKLNFDKFMILIEKYKLESILETM